MEESHKNKKDLLNGFIVKVKVKDRLRRTDRGGKVSCVFVCENQIRYWISIIGKV